MFASERQEEERLIVEIAATLPTEEVDALAAKYQVDHGMAKYDMARAVLAARSLAQLIPGADDPGNQFDIV